MSDKTAKNDSNNREVNALSDLETQLRSIWWG